MRRLLAVGFGLAMLLGGRAGGPCARAAEEPPAEPATPDELRALDAPPRAEVRHALIVGNNLGKHPERALRYAEHEVAKLAGLLKGWGDFDTVSLLRGATRGQLEAALQKTQAAMERARNAGKSTMFLFYYSGHGDNEALELGGTRFALRDLRNYLEDLPADVRLAFVDACQSGALTGVKGGRRAPAYMVRLADPGSVKGLAIVTSSTANELSQESDELQGSFFSHNIMSGLRGAADASRDGQVTLSELYQYTFKRTLANTAASLIGGQHPTYETKMAGAGEVILTRTRPSDAQLTFPREKGVTYSVFRAGLVTAELMASPEHEVYLALPAGQYRVVRRALGSVTAKELTLGAGSITPVQPGVMIALRMEENQRKKGGDDLLLRERTGTVMGVHAGMLSSVFPGTDAAVAALGLSFMQSFSWASLRLRADLSRFDGQPGQGYTTSYTRMAPSLDLLLPLFETRRFAVLAGPSAGYVHAKQKADLYDQTAEGRSHGFAYGGVLGAAAEIYRGMQLWLNVGGGGEMFRQQGGASEMTTAGPAVASRRVNRAVYNVTLGAAFGF